MKIKGISKAVLLLALLTSTSFAAGKNVNVEFSKGHSSAQYSGEIKGYDYDTYTFYAKKGQKVHVSISNEGADTYLFGPGIDDSVDLSRYSPELDSHGQYSLPASGKYEQGLEGDALKKAFAEYRAKHITPQEEEILRKGVTDGDFHYLGSAKIMCGIGRGFGEALLESLKK